MSAQIFDKNIFSNMKLLLEHRKVSREFENPKMFVCQKKHNIIV